MEMRQCANCGEKLEEDGRFKYPSLSDLKIMYASKRDRSSAMIYDVACFWIERIKIPEDEVVCEECFWK